MAHWRFLVKEEGEVNRMELIGVVEVEVYFVLSWWTDSFFVSLNLIIHSNEVDFQSRRWV